MLKSRTISMMSQRKCSNVKRLKSLLWKKVVTIVLLYNEGLYMIKKLLFLCLFALSAGNTSMIYAADDMPELSCAAQDEEDAEMMESLYDQAEIKQDSRLAAWIKYHGAKIYARYLIAK